MLFLSKHYFSVIAASFDAVRMVNNNRIPEEILIDLEEYMMLTSILWREKDQKLSMDKYYKYDVVSWNNERNMQKKLSSYKYDNSYNVIVWS